MLGHGCLKLETGGDTTRVNLNSKKIKIKGKNCKNFFVVSPIVPVSIFDELQ